MMALDKWAGGILIALCMLFFAAFRYDAHKANTFAVSQMTAAQAIKAENAALASAKAFEAKAESADAAKDSALSRASTAEKRANGAEAKYRALAKVAPDTCIAIVVSADSALTERDSVNVQLRSALKSAQVANSAYKAAVDTLRPPSAVLVTSSAALVTASSPSFMQRITPHVGFGAAAGVDATGTPRVIVGVTLGWAF